MKWYEASGNQQEVTISTRIRLARNLKDYPFPWRMTAAEKREVLFAVYRLLTSLAPDFHLILLEELSSEQAISLVECHLLPPEMVTERKGCGLIVSSDESISVIVNGQDHIRLQALQAGEGLQKAYAKIEKFDTALENSFRLAFDDYLGYLSANPGELGTGMKASLLLHLPAMQESNSIRRIAANLNKIGITVQGVYGDWSEPKGALYQVSNQVMLGLSEKTALENLQKITQQLILREKNLRAEISSSENYQDTIWRSYGLLQSARMLSNDEFLKLISNLRFGISVGMMDNITIETIDRLMIEVQPATLFCMQGNGNAAQLDKLRAEIVRNAIR